tara:strand:+ start:339 stop:1466 length:1128 start_codon:yes stop_codon:yes gene_type:complete
MAVNAIFKTNNLASIQSERNLYSDLIKEAIQIYGHDVYYVDRTLVARDDVLGEDSLSKFVTQHPIEMYVEDASGGYAGEREIITQFGLENRNEITFVVNKKRFQELDSQITLEDGTGTTGGSLQLEAGTIDQTATSSRLETVTQSFITLTGTDSSSTDADDKIMLEDDNTSFILSEESGSEFYLINDSATTDADRPQEGDLIYTPILKKMFEISFVDHDDPFHQLDNNPVYKLRCKQYEYSQEVIDTGITEVDAVETTFTADTGEHQFTLEQSSTYNEDIRLEDDNNTGLLLEETDGDNIIMEDETTSAGENILLENAADSGDKSYLLQETYIVGDASTTSSDVDKSAQNELFDQLDDDVLDFSETNPFGDAGGK